MYFWNLYKSNVNKISSKIAWNSLVTDQKEVVASLCVTESE